MRHFIYILLFLPAIIHAQLPCTNLTIDAGDDITICAPGENVTLNGSAIGPYGSVEWTPSAGLSDPTSLTPSVFVSTTTTFTLTAYGQGAAQNIIVNGDFSAGDTGFSSQYTNGVGGPWGILSAEGTYEVGANTGTYHSNWNACTDHTGGGNMMIVNGATTPNESVWCQTVAVMPNTTYEFGAWLMSIISGNPAVLQFSINGSLLGAPFNVPPAPCQWNQFFETWNSGGNTSVEICIVNQNTQAGGNDFAIDDITFGPVCVEEDEVTVFVVDPIAIVVPAAVIPCDNGGVGITLDGTGSSTGTDITYLWTTSDGHIVSGETTLMPTVDEAGTYTLTVSQNASFSPCTATAQVTVIEDIPPTVVANTTQNIDCDNPLGTVSGVGSTVTATTIFQWTTSDGTIVAGEDAILATVGAGGTYILTVTDLANGCTGVATTDVTSDLNFPTAEAEPDGNLDCVNATVTIDGSGSSGGTNLEYEWSTTNGNITTSTTDPTIDVNEPGTYQLIVTNTDNGCTAITLAQVTGDLTPPDVVISPPANIDCATGSLSLDASGSSGGGALGFEWTTSDGNITFGEMTAMPEVDELGTYVLIVTDDSNGCTATDSVTVNGDLTPPDIDIADPEELTCTVEEIILDGSGSAPGVSFSWMTGDGSLTAGADEAIATANAVGTYTLTITNPDNGCTNSADVEVTADQSLPVADAGPGDEIDCGLTELDLDGTGSSTGTDISYLWTTGDGNIVSGETGLSPTVNQAGTYTLTVTNSTTGCTAMNSVVISQNNDLPTVTATVAGELNCDTPNLEIDATGSSSGVGFTFEWTTTNGNFAAGENTLLPTVDEAGEYTLTVTNLASNCTATFEVSVPENFTTPMVNPGAPFTLNCNDPTFQIDGTASVFAAGANIEWATMDGNITAGASTLEPTVDEAGTYTLIITDADSGCADTSSVNITEDVAEPDADAGSPDTLDCVTTTLSLNGGNSSQGANFEYEWTTSDGNILNGETTLMPEIDAAGTYQVLVTNTQNGCTSTSEVAIGSDGDFPFADAGMGDELTCVFTETNLNGSADTGSDFTYLWTTSDGNILSGETTLSPEIDAPGTYLFTVTNLSNGCTSTDFVEVTENVAAPSADAGQPMELSCTLTELNLSGNGSAAGSVSLEWTTVNGNILSGATTENPLVNAAGDYLLTVTAAANGCTATSTVEVTEDASLPTADAGTADDLTCLVLSLDLDASGSSQGAQFSYEWTTGDGNIVSGANSLNPTVNEPGTYLLTVTNTVSNCESISTVTVVADDQAPDSDAGQPGTLTCDVTALSLDGTGSAAGADFEYEWTTLDGNILANADTPEPTVDEPGTYEILVTNTLTGCTATATVLVSENTTPPAAVADTPGLLTCETTELELDASGTSTGVNFEYEWTTIDGNILANATTLAPQIGEPGTYEILVTNTQNGCTSTASVTVDEDTQAPTAAAGPTDELTCETTSLTLDGSGSSQGADFIYSWETSNGNILAGGTSLAPQIDEPGDYLLTVTDEQNGCTAEAAVAITEDVTPPVIVILPPANLTCVTDEIQVDASGSSGGTVFDWGTAPGNITGGQGTPTITVDVAGTYILVVTNPENGCTASQNVNVNSDIDLPDVEAGATFELHCNLPTGELDGSTDVAGNDQSIGWATVDGELISGASTLSPTIGSAGTYLLTVTNLANGCSASDEVTISENVLADFQSETVSPGCLNPTGAVEFTEVSGGQTPYAYSVDGGASFASQTVFGNLPPGVYDLVVRDANGCELDDVAFLPEPPEVLVFLDADEIIDLGDSYQFNAQTNLLPSEIERVEWTPSATLSCADCLDPLATPFEQTSYTVLVESKEGCTATATMTLFVKKDADIYVPNAFSPNGDGINDVFHIFAGGNAIQEVKTFRIYSRWGESVFEYFDFQPNDPNFGWDGMHRGELMNPAVFVWFAEVELIDGSTRFLEGDVHLMK